MMGVAFLLTIIDVSSRKAWMFPLKHKSGSAVSAALRNFEELENFRYLQTDKGKEFYNSDVRRVLELVQAYVILAQRMKQLRHRLLNVSTEHLRRRSIDI